MDFLQQIVDDITMPYFVYFQDKLLVVTSVLNLTDFLERSLIQHVY